MPGSSLSHHLEKLRIVDLVNVKREGTFLRYTANVEGLRELLTFLFAECCTRNQVVPLAGFADICGTGLSVLNESCCPPTGGSGT